MIKSKHHPIQERYKNNMEKQMSDDERIKTPMTVIGHSIQVINNRLDKGQYFFMDIRDEGIILYVNGNWTRIFISVNFCTMLKF